MLTETGSSTQKQKPINMLTHISKEHKFCKIRRPVNGSPL